MMFRIITSLLAFAARITSLSITAWESSCGALPSGQGYTINSTPVNAGALNIENITSINDFPFCRVFGRIPYGSNDTINFEVWLPEASNYSGRYLSVGNGGFAGTIDYATMLTNLNAGFAVGGCDSGHLASENSSNKRSGYVPFLNSPAQTAAWIRDSIAAFSVPARAITISFYRSPPKKMYYYGCSTGGAQGYALAEHYPDIFDGIFAGSAGNWYTHLMLSFLWNGLHANKPGAFVDSETLKFVRDAVVTSCDLNDGVKDGVIEDPAKCKFNVSSLLCHGDNDVMSNKTTCLKAAQVATLHAFYAGPGKKVYPGFAKGSESEWLFQESVLYADFAVPILQNLVFKDLNYNYTNFNFASDIKIVDDVAGPLITATSPKLDSFKKRGGKLIETQGWADPYNAPFWPIQQHDHAKAIYGKKQLDDFWRLFMVPGGGHCGPADSYLQVPGSWHTLDALIPWVEDGVAPQDILATTPVDGSNTTRKLCPYPKHAVYKGGHTGDYRSYICG